ncbi:MAG: hypothetical protein ACKVVT_03355 [Dehalococcoidia bacterium]
MAWIAVLTIAALVAAGSARTTARERALVPEAALTFGELGWTDAVALTRDSPVAGVSFELPAGAAQGAAAWYAVELDYRWEGVPPFERPAYLYAKWNGRALYQLEVMQDSTSAPGFRWSMVDLVQGDAAGISRSGIFEAASANFATNPGIRGGPNTVTVELDLSLAGDSDARAVVFPTSKVIVTRWGPANIDLRGGADVEGNRLKIDATARNSGIAAPLLAGDILVSYSDGSFEAIGRDWGAGLGPNGSRRIREDIVIQRPDPERVHVALEWGTGRRAFRVYPAEPNHWWSSVPFLRPSLPGAVVAVVVLWIALPAALRSTRGTIRRGSARR